MIMVRGVYVSENIKIIEQIFVCSYLLNPYKGTVEKKLFLKLVKILRFKNFQMCIQVLSFGSLVYFCVLYKIH